MKKFLSLLVASGIMGFLFFAVALWVLKFEQKVAVSYGLVAAASGFITSYFRPLLVFNFGEKRKKRHRRRRSREFQESHGYLKPQEAEVKKHEESK